MTDPLASARAAALEELRLRGQEDREDLADEGSTLDVARYSQGDFLQADASRFMGETLAKRQARWDGVGQAVATSKPDSELRAAVGAHDLADQADAARADVVAELPGEANTKGRQATLRQLIFAIEHSASEEQTLAHIDRIEKERQANPAGLEHFQSALAKRWAKQVWAAGPRKEMRPTMRKRAW